MNMKEYHNIRRKKFAELHKKRVDDSYEYYCSLSDEDKQIAEFTFASKLAKHFGLSMGIVRKTASALVEEYKIEFCKYKHSNPSFGFAGKKHSDETKAVIKQSTIERNKERVIRCSELNINYRNYRQDADKQIEVADFSKARVKSISEKIIV